MSRNPPEEQLEFPFKGNELENPSNRFRGNLSPRVIAESLRSLLDTPIPSSPLVPSANLPQQEINYSDAVTEREQTQTQQFNPDCTTVAAVVSGWVFKNLPPETVITNLGRYLKQPEREDLFSLFQCATFAIISQAEEYVVINQYPEPEGIILDILACCEDAEGGDSGGGGGSEKSRLEESIANTEAAYEVLNEIDDQLKLSLDFYDFIIAICVLNIALTTASAVLNIVMRSIAITGITASKVQFIQAISCFSSIASLATTNSVAWAPIAATSTDSQTPPVPPHIHGSVTISTVGTTLASILSNLAGSCLAGLDGPAAVIHCVTQIIEYIQENIFIAASMAAQIAQISATIADQEMRMDEAIEAASLGKDMVAQNLDPKLANFKNELSNIDSIDGAIAGGSANVSTSNMLRDDLDQKISQIKSAMGDAQAFAEQTVEAARTFTNDSTALISQIQTSSTNALNSDIRIS